MHAIGVPDQYILQRSGWSSDNVMKSVYRNAIDIGTVRQNRKINEYFGKISCDTLCDTSWICGVKYFVPDVYFISKKSPENL